MQRGIIASDYCRRPGWVLNTVDRQAITQLIHDFNLA